MADTHPNLALDYNWGVGENVKAGMDANLRLLGAVVHLAVRSRTSGQPADPAEGARYIVTDDASWGGNTGDIAVFLDETWRYFTPADGWQAKVEEESVRLEYDAAVGAWVPFGLPSVATVISSGAALTLDRGQAPVWDVTLDTDPVAIAFANWTPGVYDELLLYARQDSTGGRTIDWPSEVIWPDGSEPTPNMSADTVSVWKFRTLKGGSEVFGFPLAASFG